MRACLVLVLLCPSVAFAQTREIDEAIKQKLATLKFIASLETPQGGFAVAPQPPEIDAIPQPSLRATSGAVRAWKYLGGEKLGAKFPNQEKHAAFVLKCYDPKTGGFAEPGGEPDVTITSIGVMAAVEFGIPREKFAKAMDYLKANAKTFEEVRIAAAAVEAWGVKDSPIDTKKLAGQAVQFGSRGTTDPVAMRDGGARDFGSTIATALRLGSPINDGARKHTSELLRLGQRDDGGYGKKGEKESDIETTYRVMRAFVLLKEKPKDVAAVRKFVAAHRNVDGGYGMKPGEKSSMSGVYYAVVISGWLDEMK
jgi:hypothetical protein